MAHEMPPFPPLSSSALDADLAPRLDGLDKPTVWHEFTPLANEYQSINLGQGFPNWDPPEFCVAHMNESVDPRYGRDANQYARPNAHLPLATVLAREYTAKLSRAIDPATEVASTVGCTNALFCALMGLIGGGDEVILMEPAFDLYVAQVKLAGGTVVAVPLRPSPTLATDDDPNANDSFQLDFEELEGKISPRSKVLILNTPHNPTGKMFSRSEMEALAGIVERHPQLTVITDEVYEHIVFDDVNSPHIHFASLPGMYERTLTLSSSGKTFSATGWKVGWAIGPPHLIRAVTSIQQWCNFSSPTPNQDAIALSLETASRDPYQSHPTYYSFLRSTYLHKRNLLLDVLRGANMTPIVPDGAFFVVAETSPGGFSVGPDGANGEFAGRLCGDAEGLGVVSVVDEGSGRYGDSAQCVLWRGEGGFGEELVAVRVL
eukprot:CAMPEP_0172491222 /NCGR_PEP_ID=MMETSP1066-20121228/21950_1 /TAXON_ID=671091 /ORGANISM="Coscinodiscus wailesii, Strain CCMP2513" /LENGTH=432 /DNA_ID=CAMNT_0013260159 /DNA_START=149 /DNA_END=1445 /DNA_ORIENTATION=+